MTVGSVHAKLASAGISQPKLEELFKKVLSDLQVHGNSIQTKWTDMFVQEYSPLTQDSPHDRKIGVTSRSAESHDALADR